MRSKSLCGVTRVTPFVTGLFASSTPHNIRRLTYPSSGYADSASVHLQELRNKLSHKLFSTGRLYQKMGYYDPATMYYNKLLEDYPNSPFAEESVFRAGECYLKLEKYIPAREKLLSYVDSYKDGKFHKKAVSLLRKIEDIKKAEN